MKIDYFRHEGLTENYFACSRLKCTLSVSTCAGRYVTSLGNQVNLLCKGCEIGAHHSGRKVRKAVTASPKLCARCLTSSVRMVGGRICVSCYNRTRETKLGRNAKGGQPRKLSAVYTLNVGIFRCDSRTIVYRVADVASYVEAVISVGRTEAGSSAGAFSWSSGLENVLERGDIRRAVMPWN